MKKNFFIMALLCVLFAGCNKDVIIPPFSEADEDLSFIKTTYTRVDYGTYIQKTQTQYDGNKIIGFQQWRDDELVVERKNFTYDGLNCQWDTYYYGNTGGVTRNHVECEYLDESFERVKYSKTEAYFEDPQNDYIAEAFYEFDGKKKVGFKNYNNGLLANEHCDTHYDGLHCTYQHRYYSSSGAVTQENDYNILYLDDTYLRIKSYMRTRTFTGGNPITTYYVNEYEGKKIVGTHTYHNGELTSVYRDYQYDGLVCHYKIDYYQDGEVYLTTDGEARYLK